MGSLTTAAIVASVFFGGLAIDVGVNALQDWYGTFYNDAFWSHRVQDSPALRDLRAEEAEIERLLADTAFAGAKIRLDHAPRPATSP